jgi:hypothetical protein
VLSRGLDEADEVLVAVSPVLVEAAADAVFPHVGLGAKIAGAVAGVVADRLARLRRDRIADRPDDNPPGAFRRARTALGRVNQRTNRWGQDPPDQSALLRDVWIADEALHRLASFNTRIAPNAEQALCNLRELRDAAQSFDDADPDKAEAFKYFAGKAYGALPAQP